MPLDPRRVAMLQEMGITVWTQDHGGSVAAIDAAADADADADAALADPDSTGTASRAAAVPKRAVAEPEPEPLRWAAPAPPAPVGASSPAAGPVSPETVARMDWAALRDTVVACRACGLCDARRQVVFGVGDEQADWMVVGEAPGEQEDRQGEPFVGPAGRLLDNMLQAIGLARDAAGQAHPGLPGIGRGVYIANVLKCRPPGNRNPQPDEVAHCLPYLRRQIALVRPRLILAMGRFAVQALLQSEEPIGRLRGRVHRIEGIPTIVTYHPAYLLRQLADKAKAWDDLCLAVRTMREMVPGATAVSPPAPG